MQPPKLNRVQLALIPGSSPKCRDRSVIAAGARVSGSYQSTPPRAFWILEATSNSHSSTVSVRAATAWVSSLSKPHVDDKDTSAAQNVFAERRAGHKRLTKGATAGLLEPQRCCLAIKLAQYPAKGRHSSKTASLCTASCRLPSESLRSWTCCINSAVPEALHRDTRPQLGQLSTPFACGTWLQPSVRDCLNFAGLRKPAMDLFAPRAALMMPGAKLAGYGPGFDSERQHGPRCCFCIVLISWNSLMDNSESFADSLSSSSFSGKQALPGWCGVPVAACCAQSGVSLDLRA